MKLMKRRLNKILISILVVWCITSVPVLAETMQVVRAVDGDTLVLKNGTSLSYYRFACVDAPEVAHTIAERVTIDPIKKDQFLWGEASKSTVEKLLTATVDVNVTDIDNYGRYVADITLATGENLQIELLKRGMAQVYPKYIRLCPDSVGKTAAQYDAHKDKLGIWSDNAYINPWTFRSQNK